MTNTLGRSKKIISSPRPSSNVVIANNRLFESRLQRGEEHSLSLMELFLKTIYKSVEFKEFSKAIFSYVKHECFLQNINAKIQLLEKNILEKDFNPYLLNLSKNIFLLPDESLMTHEQVLCRETFLINVLKSRIQHHVAQREKKNTEFHSFADQMDENLRAYILDLVETSLKPSSEDSIKNYQKQVGKIVFQTLEIKRTDIQLSFERNRKKHQLQKEEKQKKFLEKRNKHLNEMVSISTTELDKIITSKVKNLSLENAKRRKPHPKPILKPNRENRGRSVSKSRSPKQQQRRHSSSTSGTRNYNQKRNKSRGRSPSRNFKHSLAKKKQTSKSPPSFRSPNRKEKPNKGKLVRFKQDFQRRSRN